MSLGGIVAIKLRATRIQTKILSSISSIFASWNVDHEMDTYEKGTSFEEDDEHRSLLSAMTGGGSSNSKDYIFRSVSLHTVSLSSTSSLEGLNSALASSSLGESLTCFETFLLLWHNPDSYYNSGFNWHHGKWTCAVLSMLSVADLIIKGKLTLSYKAPKNLLDSFFGEKFYIRVIDEKTPVGIPFLDRVLKYIVEYGESKNVKEIDCMKCMQSMSFGPRLFNHATENCGFDGAVQSLIDKGILQKSKGGFFSSDHVVVAKQDLVNSLRQEFKTAVLSGAPINQRFLVCLAVGSVGDQYGTLIFGRKYLFQVLTDQEAKDSESHIVSLIYGGKGHIIAADAAGDAEEVEESELEFEDQHEAKKKN